MKVRALLELTVDIANPAAELTNVISAVLGAIPQHQRESILRSLDEGIGAALAEIEAAKATPE